MKVELPKVSPLTSPELSIVATEGLLLIQVPPEEGNSWIVFPWQTSLGPDRIGGAVTFTVVVTEFEQLLPSVKVYVIKDEPDEIPLTIPFESMVTTDKLSLDQTPPRVVLDKVVVVSGHKVVFPVIGFTVGNG